jgi:hypothetical protein
VYRELILGTIVGLIQNVRGFSIKWLCSDKLISPASLKSGWREYLSFILWIFAMRAMIIYESTSYSFVAIVLSLQMFVMSQ